METNIKEAQRRNQKKPAFSNTKLIGITIMALGGFSAVALFAACLCASCIYCDALISGEQGTKMSPEHLQELQEQQRQNLQSSRSPPSQYNTPEAPPPPYSDVAGGTFLPYPNTGTAYHAPCTNPV